MKREKTELEEKIERLEDENETLSFRPYTAMTSRALSRMSDTADVSSSTTSLTSYRRQPTGLSEIGDNTSMSHLLDQRREIEAEIKKKQTEQRYLKNRLRKLKSLEPGPVESQACVLQ